MANHRRLHLYRLLHRHRKLPTQVGGHTMVPTTYRGTHSALAVHDTGSRESLALTTYPCLVGC